MAQAFNLTAKINLQGPYNLRPIISKIKRDLGSIKPDLKFKLDPAAAKSVKAVTAEIKKLDAAAKSAQKSVGSLNSSLQSLAASFNSAATASKNAASATNAASKATANAAKAASQARTAMEEFGKQSGLAIKRFAAFSAVTTVIYGLTNAITDAYKEFLIFNKEIVRLSQVTDKSVSDLSGITKEITRLSTSIGVASSDLIGVASTLAQAGLSAEDTRIALEALAKSSLAPSFENITDTTEGAIAAIRQFGLQASELEAALGSINAVAAAFAVESGDIIAAIQRTGGVFAASSRGVSEGTDALNEFIAIFTSVRQTTRESAETIATGLRTIFTRIQRSSTIDLLKQYGIELRDLEGKFVGPYEAVRRLSEGLNRIDPRSAEFARISEELGGFRQIGKVIPLIQQFAVAQDALNVAQRGAGSLTKDVVTAQQSLVVQFTKTRENFLALVREIGDSSSFKVFVSSTLFLTNALIDLGRILKPLLPLLLTFAAIKLGSAATQFAGGFGGVFGLGLGGRGGGPAPGGGVGPTGGGGGGGGGNQPLTAALSANTTTNSILNQTLTALNTSVLSLNQNIVNTNSLLLNRPTKGFASGGLVPGRGNSDTVRANLTPGEFVLRKRAVEAIGVDNLAKMNSGGFVRKYVNAGAVTPLNDEEILSSIFGTEFNQTEKVVLGKEIAGQRVRTSASDIRKSRSLSVLSRRSGLSLEDLQKAQTSLKTRSTQLSAEAEAKRQALLQEKKTAIQENRVLDFGLVGLRYGSSSKDKDQKKIDSLKFNLPRPRGFRQTQLNIREMPNSNAFIRIKSATIAQKLKGSAAKQFQNTILNNFEKSVIQAARQMASKVPTGLNIDPSLIKQSVQNAEFYNVIGSALEASLGILGSPIFPKTEQTKSIDFPGGLGAASKIFGPEFENIPTDVTRTIGGEGKGVSRYKEQIGRWLSTPAGQSYLSKFPNVKGFAVGGDVSGSDTVPALLTPGEFVFNKEAAQRIGYNNLNRMNKVQKFNKGGSVGPQKFAVGGGVDSVLVTSVVMGVLTQEIEKVASTFTNLDGQMKDFGIVTADVVKSVTSQLASTTIALQAMGVSGKTLALTQVGGALGAGVGAGITSSSTRTLDKLLATTNAQLGEFDKNLKDVNEAATEELRASAAKRLEQSFIQLDNTVRSNVEAANNAEQYQKLGNAITNVTSGILATVTAMSALRLATVQQTTAANSAALAPGSVGAAAGAAAAGAGAVGFLGSTIGIVSRFAFGIGLAISAVQILVEVIGFFSSKTKASVEQLDKLNEKLKQTVENSTDYNLANRTFVDTILPRFRELENQARQQPGDFSTNLKRLITQQGGDLLDLRLRTQFKASAQNFGFPLRETETIADFLARVRREAPEAALSLEGFLDEIRKSRDVTDVRSALAEQGLSGAELDAEFTKLEALGRLSQVAEEYRAAQHVSILASRSAADAARKVGLNFLSLNNILAKTLQLYEKSFNNLTSAFSELDITAGGPGQDTSVLLDRAINTFKNLPAATASELETALSGVISRGNLPVEQASQLRARIVAGQVLQQQGPLLLEAVQNNFEDINGTVEEFLAPQLRRNLPQGVGSEAVIASVVNEVSASLQKLTEKDGDIAKIFADLGKDSKALSELLSSSEEATKFAITSTETFQKAQKALFDEQRKVLDLEMQIKAASLERLQTEQQDLIRLREAFDIDIPLQDRLRVFDESILQLTSGLDEGISLINQSRTTAAQRLRLVPRTGMAEAVTNQAVSSLSRLLQTGPTTNLDTIIQTRRLAREQLRGIESGGITTEKEARQQQALLKVVNSTTEALKRLANNGDQVNLVFEQIAKQRDLFKTRRELLFDLVKKFRDPAQAVELQRQFREFQAIGQAMQGRGTVSQDVLLGALTNENPFTKFFDPQQFEDFLQTGSKLLVNQQMQLSPEIKGVLLNIDQYLSTQGNTTPLIGVLEKLFNIRSKAATALEDEQKIELELRQAGIISAYGNFETDFRLAAQRVVDEIKVFQEELTATRNIRLLTESQAQTMTAGEVDFIFEQLKGLTFKKPPIMPAPTIGPGFAAPNPFSTLKPDAEIPIVPLSQQKEMRRQVGEMVAAGQSRKEIQQYIIDQVTYQLSFGGQRFQPGAADKGRFPAERTTYSGQRQEDEAFNKAIDFFRTIRTIFSNSPSSTPSRSQLLSRPPTGTDRRAAPIDSSSIDRFSGAASGLTAALTNPNNNITGLTTAVNSLGTVTTDLKTAVNQLSSLFKDGKIVVSSETKGNVSVTFDSPVTVENRDMDNRVLGELQSVIQDNIGLALNAWGRKNGITV